jgi:restriction endonuclease Mrr
VIATGAEVNPFTHRRRVSSLVLPVRHQDQQRVELVTITPALLSALVADASLVFRISPATFEELLCDRLFAMGFEPRKTGKTNHKDGGVDIVFWPRSRAAFPVLGAVQAKHHKNPDTREGSGVVRDFAAAVGAHPFNAGLLVTNTAFTPDAKWFAKERAALVRLRDLVDLRRWLANRFDDPAEWRDLPSEIQLCPGVTVRLDR